MYVGYINYVVLTQNAAAARIQKKNERFITFQTMAAFEKK